ncbi:KR domain-containing protein [Streptomyces sp. KL116D]|uniref:KR domain-containing protein n=1 Tax=Streptomyces sp. KL116D TaxID=3045152 RepID=UPI003555D088
MSWSAGRGGQAPRHAELAAEAAALGAGDAFAACDVTDRAGLTDLVASLARQGERIRCGDAPGRSDDRAVADLDPAELARVTRAKTVGARLLDELCADAETFVLFSSNTRASGAAKPARRLRRGQRTSTPSPSGAGPARPGRDQHRLGAWADGGMADADLPRTDQARTAPDGPRQGAARPPARPWTSEDSLRRPSRTSAGDFRFAVGFTAARPRSSRTCPTPTGQAPAAGAEARPGDRAPPGANAPPGCPLTRQRPSPPGSAPGGGRAQTPGRTR